MMMISEQLDRFILEHRRCLRYTRPEDVPVEPTQWVLDRFDGGMDSAYILATLLGLIIRGVTVADCARYAAEEAIELPFLGVERAVFDTTIAAMRERGIEPTETAQVIELMGMMIEAVHRTSGLPFWPGIAGPAPEIGHA